MKKLFLMIFVTILLFSSCKKEKPDSKKPPYVPSNVEVPQQGNITYNAVMDVDGHWYDAVNIGNKMWMIQNMRTTRFYNGEEIPMGSVDVFSDELPYRYAPDANSSNIAKYGYLYNWPAVMHGENGSGSNPSGVQGICPQGWHVPSNEEWRQLVNYLGTQKECQCGEIRDNIAKSLASTSGWQECSSQCAVGNNQEENNSTHFCAFPAGRGGGNVNSNIGRDAYFWTCSESAIWDGVVLDFELDFYSALTYVGRGAYKHTAMSVRCVRD